MFIFNEQKVFNIQNFLQTQFWSWTFQINLVQCFLKKNISHCSFCLDMTLYFIPPLYNKLIVAVYLCLSVSSDCNITIRSRGLQPAVHKEAINAAGCNKASLRSLGKEQLARRCNPRLGADFPLAWSAFHSDVPHGLTDDAGGNTVKREASLKRESTLKTKMKELVGRDGYIYG